MLTHCARAATAPPYRTYRRSTTVPDSITRPPPPPESLDELARDLSPGEVEQYGTRSACCSRGWVLVGHLYR